jgi:hypothetical protein
MNQPVRADQFLGRPVKALVLVGFCGFPFAAIGLLAAQVAPQQVPLSIWGSCLAWLAACMVLWTPYLLAACGCFFALGQLPFPRSMAPAVWLPHASLLVIAGICLWRTWLNWPAHLRSKSLPKDTKPAPWWGYVLGGLASVGLFGLMAYYFHFQD